MNMWKPTGERIKAIREREGLSQAEFGSMLGISGPSVSQIEAAERKPALRTIIDIAEKFGVSTDFLLLGREGSCQGCSFEKAAKDIQNLSVRDQQMLQAVVSAFINAATETIS